MNRINQLFIDKQKRKYLQELNTLRQQRDQLMTEFCLQALLELTHQQKKLVNKIVKEILAFYLPVFKNQSIGIFWNGGFARNSNRLSGDYDLNFVYPETLRSQIYPLEEEICSSLAQIVGKPQDYVHSALSCHVKLLQEPGNLEGLEKLMFKVQWASREPEALKKYLLASISADKCCDWTATYEIVYGRDLLEGIFQKVVQKEFNRYGEKEYLNDFPELLKKRQTILHSLQDVLLSANLGEVKQIKEHFKKSAFDQIFAVLALIRRRLMAEKINVGSIKIDEYSQNNQIKQLLGEDLTTKLFYQIFYYIWVIVRLEAIFEKKDIRFGVHSIQTIDKSFNKLYQKWCPDVSVDFTIYHQTKIKQLYSVLEEVLVKLREAKNGK